MSALPIDLEAFDAAIEAGDRVRLRQLAHRLCSACHQLDEESAVAALRAVEALGTAEGAGSDAVAQGLCAAARGELVAALSRAEAFASRHGSLV